MILLVISYVFSLLLLSFFLYQTVILQKKEERTYKHIWTYFVYNYIRLYMILYIYVYSYMKNFLPEGKKRLKFYRRCIHILSVY